MPDKLRMNPSVKAEIANYQLTLRQHADAIEQNAFMEGGSDVGDEENLLQGANLQPPPQFQAPRANHQPYLYGESSSVFSYRCFFLAAGLTMLAYHAFWG